MLGRWDLCCRCLRITGGSASGGGGDDGRARGDRVATRLGSDVRDCDGSRGSGSGLSGLRWDCCAGV